MSIDSVKKDMVKQETRLRMYKSTTTKILRMFMIKMKIILNYMLKTYIIYPWTLINWRMICDIKT